MDYFTPENAQGYTQADLDELNAQCDAMLEAEGHEPYTPDWHEAVKRFADTVANR